MACRVMVKMTNMAIPRTTRTKIEEGTLQAKANPQLKPLVKAHTYGAQTTRPGLLILLTDAIE